MVGQASMASSGPEGQSLHSPAAPQHTSQEVPLPSFMALASATGNVENPEPYTPNEMSAAAILATLSDSRPPTSHAEDGFLSDSSGGDDDDNEGGVPLHQHLEPEPHYGNVLDQVPVALQPTYHAPTIPADQGDFMYALEYSVSPNTSSVLHNLQSYPSYTALDHHAAAFEILSMDQADIPPPFPPSVPETLPADSTEVLMHVHNHMQEFMTTAYEDNLNLHDQTAFTSPHLFYFQTTAQKEIAMGLEEAEDDDLPVITRDDLQGEGRDYQGIIWSKRMPRREFRAKRARLERGKLQKWMRQYPGWEQPYPIPNHENFFSFRKTDKRHRPWGPHFQLRNVMAVTSRQDIYYAKRFEGIFKTDASGSEAKTVLDTSKHTVNGNRCMITTLAAMNGVLIAGGFDGEYAVVDLASSTGPQSSMNVIRDWAPDTKSYITNHVNLFNDRSSYTPQAVICSNDNSLRVLDCATNTFRYKFPFQAAVNCSATSPDGRLRVVVGDFSETLITNAETGETLQTLNAHVGDAFACAWADDGIHVASAAQDASIAVWDARSWKQPLTMLTSELSIPRVLKFSPIGSGPRVLVSAEADDYVSIINATTFDSKQTFDFFGRTGGVDFTPDGQSLFVANSEFGLGGIIELERAGGWDKGRIESGVENTHCDEDAMVDWAYDSDLDAHPRVVCSAEERNRWGLDLGRVDV